MDALKRFALALGLVYGIGLGGGYLAVVTYDLISTAITENHVKQTLERQQNEHI